MKAIVLAGGFGTRIQPLTNSLPKPMLPILNRPMMEHIIIKLRDDLGITEIAVLLYFKPEVIKNHFKDGKELGVNITYFQPDDDYGTAGAVGFAREFLNERFIIVSGDLVTDFDFKAIARFHEQKSAKVTIALTPVENPLQFGVVIANKKGEIEKFLEKPSWGEVFSDTINTGIYLIEPEILNYIPIEENYDFAKDLFPTLMKENITLWGCHIEGYWRDVGNPESYRDVYTDIYNKLITLNPKGELKKPDATHSGYVLVGKNTRISDTAHLSNCIIGDNVTIYDEAKLTNCVIWDNCEIGTKTQLNDAIICNNNHIAKKVKAKHGIIMAEGCDIESGVSFEKDVIVWPEKVISENAVISNNVIWGNKHKSSLIEAGKVVGRTNLELSCEMVTKLAESFGSILPVGSTIYVSRDYHKSSRMLKRAFLGGMMSTGINIINLENAPSIVARYNLSVRDDVIAGVHFRQSIINQIDTEIMFYTSEGLQIDSNLAKSIERIFYRENFRRVNFNEIGEVLENGHAKTNYIASLIDKVDKPLFKNNEIRVVADVMFGSTSDIYPHIMNELFIENIILNAYKDDRKLSKVPTLIKHSQENTAKIVKSMDYDCGILLYPNGQKVQFISDKGVLIYDYIMLLVTLELLNASHANKHKAKAYIPAWAPDYVSYPNVEITYGKFGGFKAKDLKNYDMVATTDGHFGFMDFTYNTDAVYASFKILEILQKTGLKLSTIVEKIPEFAYKGENIACPSELKGKMMRKFLEDSKDKRSSHLDGIKIWVGENDWILMVPDDHHEFLNLYAQAKNEKTLNKIVAEYKGKIENWINE